MYRRIVLAYDGSESGQSALLNCREIAQWSHAELFLVAVMPLANTYLPVEGGFYEDANREAADRKRFEDILAEGLRRLSDSGFATAHGEVVVGDPVYAITEYAQHINADLIVVGHRHHDSWAARWWRGSTARALIEHAPCSVLVVITR